MTESLMKELDSLPTILNMRDLKNALRMSERSIYRIVKDPDVHAFKDGTEWNILKSDLIAWLDKNE